MLSEETEQTPKSIQPKKTPLVLKYPKLAEIYEKLDRQNHKIHQNKQQLEELQEEPDNIKGLFKGKKHYSGGNVLIDNGKHLSDFELDFIANAKIVK